MIYLASPYSHPDPSVREARFKVVAHVAAALMTQGKLVFSPVTHSHPIAECRLRSDWEYWEQFDRWFIERCDELDVLMLPGWQQSSGVTHEISIALSINKLVICLRPSDFSIPSDLIGVIRDAHTQAGPSNA